MRVLWIAAVLAACCGCALAQSAPESAAPLLQADRDFNAATSARGLDGWMEFMTDETVLQREKPYIGREAIRATMTPDWSNPDFKLTWKPESGQLFDSGTMGFTTGSWELRTKDAKDKKVGVRGQYLTVWGKQKDGSWKVLWDGGTASGPLKD
ncbi:MAG: YybH family protein [Terriglobales bacterium]